MMSGVLHALGGGFLHPPPPARPIVPGSCRFVKGLTGCRECGIVSGGFKKKCRYVTSLYHVSACLSRG